MIKKSTLFILLGAIAFGAAVYYFDWKRGQKDAEKSTEDKSKPAFTIPAGSEIVSITLTRPQMAGEAPIHFEKQNGTWQIVQPIQSQADQRALGTIAESIGSARIDTTEPGSPDRLKVYGLDPPAISLDFKLKNGSEHTLKLGNKDFTNTYVYAIADGAKDVALLPSAIRTQTDLSVEFLRDHEVLHITTADVSAISLKNPAGELEAKKEKDGWTFTKPVSGKLADDTEITVLLNTVANAKVTAIVSDSAENLAKYGLAVSAITFTATDANGKTATLSVGKKEGNDYYAKDASRASIFRVNDALYKKLGESYSDLRDKKLIHLTQADFTRAELQNANGTVIVTPKTEQEWVAEAPDELKGKAVATWKILTPIISAHAEEIVDHPSADILAKLGKPLVQITLTTKDGKKVTISFTSALGDFVYARMSDALTVYKFKKNILDDLNAKPMEFAY